jgi:hypothetical protein
VPGKKTFDEQIVFKQATAAAPLELAQCTLIQK